METLTAGPVKKDNANFWTIIIIVFEQELHTDTTKLSFIQKEMPPIKNFMGVYPP